jgi:hypothetical protein
MLIYTHATNLWADSCSMLDQHACSVWDISTGLIHTNTVGIAQMHSVLYNPSLHHKLGSHHTNSSFVGHSIQLHQMRESFLPCHNLVLQYQTFYAPTDMWLCVYLCFVFCGCVLGASGPLSCFLLSHLVPVALVSSCGLPARLCPLCLCSLCDSPSMWVTLLLWLICTALDMTHVPLSIYWAWSKPGSPACFTLSYLSLPS